MEICGVLWAEIGYSHCSFTLSASLKKDYIECYILSTFFSFLLLEELLPMCLTAYSVCIADANGIKICSVCSDLWSVNVYKLLGV